MANKRHRQMSLKERAAMLSSLMREPGWELLKGMFAPEIRTRITDTDAREAFLYEAIRAQVIQEIFSTPVAVMHQAEREWCNHPINSEQPIEKPGSTAKKKKQQQSESTPE